jgi:prepilin-type processing-associated H-X9-DG protein
VPTTLSGTDAALGQTNTDHFRVLINRHRRGINLCMADGSARWVPLESLYELAWSPSWARYKLTGLPQK